MKYVIGIDGGGTKTTGVIANSDGEIFAEVTVGPSNPNSVAKDRLRDEFVGLFDNLQALDGDAFNKVEHVFAGLSGSDHSETRSEMKALIKKLLPENVRVTVDNDAITALYSGTLGTPGIVQISGTGAITYGINSAGERKRVGGWGYLFSDHGSGYSLGRDALEEVFFAHDGFREATLLCENVLAHFQVDDVPDLIRAVYHQPGTRELIASLSRLVMEAADEGDQVAREIIDRNARHLGMSISLMVDKLFSEMDKRIPVILVGGLFNRVDLLQVAVEAGLGLNKERVDLMVPEILPVGGAVIAALKDEGVIVDAEFVERFRN